MVGEFFHTRLPRIEKPYCVPRGSNTVNESHIISSASEIIRLKHAQRRTDILKFFSGIGINPIVKML